MKISTGERADGNASYLHIFDVKPPPAASGVYVCTGCGLPRSRDDAPCPSCGGRDGMEL